MSQIIPPPPLLSRIGNSLVRRSSIDASQASQLLTDPRLPDVIDALARWWTVLRVASWYRPTDSRQSPLFSES